MEGKKSAKGHFFFFLEISSYFNLNEQLLNKPFQGEMKQEFEQKKTMSTSYELFSALKAVIAFVSLTLNNKTTLKNSTYVMAESTSTYSDEFVYYNVGVLMTTKLNSPFDLERCGPAVDLALQTVNQDMLRMHRVQLRKVQAR